MSTESYFEWAEKLSSTSLINLQGDPLTLGELALALIIFFGGYFFSKIFSQKVAGSSIMRALGDASKIATIRTLIFYIMTVVFFLMALTVAHIPLTIFTVAGGALAIGIGFGSQNLLNNFISGLILLFERPIKVGDFVEIDGTFGQVEEIAFRSTKILAFGNKHIVYPNSAFLERNFTNWTLHDRIIRFPTRVGIAYGSDVDKAKDVFLKVVTDNPRILKNPQPRVVFEDFGDSALVFAIYHSIAIEQLSDKYLITSQIRFELYKALEQAGIVIAFPQRDVHLDVKEPIPVSMKT